MKSCNKCKKLLGLNEFAPHKRARDGRQSYCRKCKQEHRKKFGKGYKSQRDYALKMHYDISLDDYNLLLQKQNYRCAICLKPETSLGRGGNIRDLAVDHDHDSGKVRSLLCGGCNQAIGLIKEDFDTSLRLAKYLQHHKNVA